MKDTSYKRHLAKAITWRCVGTFDTILLSWIITGSAWMGVKIGLAEVLTKMIFYYIHERVWYRLKLEKQSANWRHLAKTISWRIVGTLDTMILAWVISGDPLVGLQVGVVEVITKMLLYYVHEKIWYRSNYGLSHRKTILNSETDE